MSILGHSCCFQSSLFTKNHCFILKALIFLPKIILKPLYLSNFICKKGESDTTSKDNNVGESVLIKVAPLYFRKLLLWKISLYKVLTHNINEAINMRNSMSVKNIHTFQKLGTSKRMKELLILKD
jgi:hypothetical protein